MKFFQKNTEILYRKLVIVGKIVENMGVFDLLSIKIVQR